MNIIFDFDGVILNSHKVKTEAFFNIFKKFGYQTALKAKNLHLKNIGGSRYYKFKSILKKLPRNKAISINSLDKKFDNYVNSGIKRLKLSPHLLNFLKKNKKKFSFHVSTGTPQNKIIKILKEKKIYQYFENIYGYPKSKEEHINKIKKNKKDTFFIGDSYSDYLVAKKTRVNFLLKLNSENKNFRNKYKINKIKSFKYLDNKINSVKFT